MDLVLLYISAYLLGSIPTAYLIGRIVKGVDILSLIHILTLPTNREV